MTGTNHALHAEIAQLRAVNDELREQVRQLEDLLKPVPFSGCPVHLTPKETALLSALLQLPAGCYASRDQLYSGMYPDEGDTDIKIVDVFACKLRKKLGPRGIVIDNLWGRGYRLAEGRELAKQWRQPPAPEASVAA